MILIGLLLLLPVDEESLDSYITSSLTRGREGEAERDREREHEGERRRQINKGVMKLRELPPPPPPFTDLPWR